MWSNIRSLQSLPARSTIQQRHRNTKSLLSYCVIYVLWNDISLYIKKLIWAKLNELTGFLIIARNRYTSALLIKVTNRLTSTYYSCLRISDITCKVTRKNRLFTFNRVHINIGNCSSTRRWALHRDIKHCYQIMELQINGLTLFYLRRCYGIISIHIGIIHIRKSEINGSTIKFCVRTFECTFSPFLYLLCNRNIGSNLACLILFCRTFYCTCRIESIKSVFCIKISPLQTGFTWVHFCNTCSYFMVCFVGRYLVIYKMIGWLRCLITEYSNLIGAISFPIYGDSVFITVSINSSGSRLCLNHICITR